MNTTNEEEEAREYARRQVKFDPDAPIVAIVPDDAQVKSSHGMQWVQTWTLAAGDSDELIFQHIDGESGKETVRMPWHVASLCGGQGEQSDNVAEWVDDDCVVFSEDPEALVRLLRSSGAWSDEELAIVPTETIKQRVLWIAACDIRENPAFYFDL